MRCVGYWKKTDSAAQGISAVAVAFRDPAYARSVRIEFSFSVASLPPQDFSLSDRSTSWRNIRGDEAQVESIVNVESMTDEKVCLSS